MNHLICGRGEIGQSLRRVLQPYYQMFSLDKNEADLPLRTPIEIMHVCFPFSEEFVSEVKRYQEKYKPKYTVIHSTVPVGTSKECNSISSPILGIHPYLDEGIKIFIKFLGGEQSSEVEHYFRRAGLKTYIFNNSETTELMKILDTSFYGLCIEYTKEVKRLCEQYQVPFEAWTLWTNNYNTGYQKLGYPEFTRPNLIPIMKKIGGHCILPNAEMLDNKFTNLIKKLNE